VLCIISKLDAFQTTPPFASSNVRLHTSLCSEKDCFEDQNNASRRIFFNRISQLSIGGILTSSLIPAQNAQATVYLDPAMYGDQENRISAVDSLRESVRRAILQNPKQASAFFTLALLDALSFDFKSGDGGPDGRIVRELLETKESSPYISSLKDAAAVLVESKKKLTKLTSITIADAVAISGVEAIQSIGGPTLSVQVGRTDAANGLKFDKKVPLDLFEGKRDINEVRSYFSRSGLTDREMTALLGALLTINFVEKDADPEAWRESAKPKYRERGKMGRMSEFKKLTDDDIADEFAKDGLDDDEDYYIADSFGTKDQAFGKKAADLDPKTFNKYLKDLSKFIQAKNNDDQQFGWIGKLLLDKDKPATQQWLAKYGSSYLNYQKDLGIAYNSMTQLGAEYTGGKYESLLKNKPRKTLNDFD